MSAIDLLQVISQLTWLALGAVAILRAIRKPGRTSRDVALFFGAIAVVTIEGRLVAALEIPAEAAVRTSSAILAMALPYLLLRLIRDFGGVRRWILRAAELGLVGAVVLILFVGLTAIPAVLYVVLYFAALALYCAARSTALAYASQGVTRRRMQAVAAGSYFLGIAILVAGVGAVAPALSGVTGGLVQICAFASALSYAVGLAPPGALKRYWQIPELRAFLTRSSTT